MNRRLAIAGLVVGALMAIAGMVLLVLCYATKAFYTDVKAKTAAGAAMTTGQTILEGADVTWDDTTIQKGTDGTFLKWSSIKSYSGTTNGGLDTYNLNSSSGSISTQTSSTGLTGVQLRGSNYLTKPSTQVWSMFPSSAPSSNYTVLFACTCPNTISATQLSGMSYFHYGDNWKTHSGAKFGTYMDTDGFKNDSGLIGSSNRYRTVPSSNTTTYTPLNETVAYADIVSSFVCSNTAVNTEQRRATFINGVIQTYAINSQTSLLLNSGSNIVNDTGCKLTIGQNIYNTTTFHVGTIYAIYVFSRALSTDEISSASQYLQQKYFAPSTRYPTSMLLDIGEALTSPIRNSNVVTGTAPITNYSISPSLPTGLVFNPTTGDITGTPTAASSSAKYTITSTNVNTTATSTIDLQVRATLVAKEFTQPPSISFTSPTYGVDPEDPVSSPAPVNTGGPITSFTIDPLSAVTNLGLTFNTNTGVISGTAQKTCRTIFTVTADNRGGSSSAVFTLLIGTMIEFPETYIQGKVDHVIKPIGPMITGASQFPQIDHFSYTGDLLGLSFDTVRGIISGKPNKSGTSDVTVSVTLRGDSSMTIGTIHISIEIDREFKSKNSVVAGGCVAVGVGTAILSVSVCGLYNLL